MRFLWGTNWIYKCYVEESRPPVWSSGQSSWLQIQRFWFDSRHYQNFREVVGMERGPLSFVSTINGLRERRSSGSGLENLDYGSRGSATPTTRHPSIRKSWHYLRRQTAVSPSVELLVNSGHRFRYLFKTWVIVFQNSVLRRTFGHTKRKQQNSKKNWTVKIFKYWNRGSHSGNNGYCYLVRSFAAQFGRSLSSFRSNCARYFFRAEK
jgi:hypothetical protein